MNYKEEDYFRSIPNLSNKIFFQSKDDFDSFIEEVDKKLIEDNVPIVGRQIKGFSEAAKTLKTQLPWVPESFAKENNFSILSLSAHISIWFSEKYGSKLGMGYALKTLVKIKGDNFLLNIPFSWGKPSLFFEFNSTYKRDGYINIAQCIDGLTNYIAQRLSKEEIQGIADRMFEAIYISEEIERTKDISMMKEAKSDFIQSAELLINNSNIPGLSMWSTLQFSEKILKAYLQSKNNEYHYTHNLKKLLDQAKSLGITNTDKYNVNIIQCKPEVRYNSGLVSISEAYIAHIEANKLAVYTIRDIK